ncbi:MAG: DUF434 domain-containing protein [Planctomycetes bacterium]|nr:DUF434 domain-containing protein [Planctomycetota bacterium]
MPGGGAHPHDPSCFAPRHLDALRRATGELAFLRARGYALPGAIKLVGDRYQLRERQRLAVVRATSEAAGATQRRARRLNPGLRPAQVWVDGFNALITVETGLRGGVLLRGIDGALRDLSGVHGTYRLNQTTDAALAALVAAFRGEGWDEVPVRWFLDRPVSNSGRLAQRVEEEAARARLPWTAEVVADADVPLAAAAPSCAVASSDAVVLDRCPAWIDLPALALAGHPAWVLELEGCAPAR